MKSSGKNIKFNIKKNVYYFVTVNSEISYEVFLTVESSLKPKQYLVWQETGGGGSLLAQNAR